MRHVHERVKKEVEEKEEEKDSQKEGDSLPALQPLLSHHHSSAHVHTRRVVVSTSVTSCIPGMVILARKFTRVGQ